MATSSITKSFMIKDDEAMERYLDIMEAPAKPLPRIKGFSMASEREKLEKALCDKGTHQPRPPVPPLGRIAHWYLLETP